MSTLFKIPPGFEDREKKCFTLALIHKGDEVLLGLKKRGLGKGLWNGFGGKLKPNENIVEAAVREIQEECGLIVEINDMEQFAVILLEFLNDPILMEVHMFKTNIFSGEVSESDEMRPQWYSKNNLPWHQMWPDNQIWYPLHFAGKKFNAYFLENYTKILSYYIRDYESNCEILKQE